ncbi:Gfo/Idh/MocA family protein [Monashia sp. NPDC004114]
MTSEDDVRIGIIGFGLRASLARWAHQPGEGSRVVAVCDTSERGRRDAAAALPDARITADLAAMLRDSADGTCSLDAVLVLTPDHVHAEHATATLSAGIPTFVEKPLATTVDDADRILAAAHRTGTRLYVGHNMRHMPVVRAMRDIVEAGTIGDVKAIWCRHFVSAGGDFYFKDWHADRSMTTGLLLQKGAHDIDVIHWLAGAYTRRVSAVGALAVYGDIPERRDNSDRRMADWYSLEAWPPTEQRDLHPVVDVEDISMANLVLDGGVLASYQQCHFTPDYWRNYTVIGTRGRLENFGDGPGAVIKVWTTRSDAYREDADEVVQVPPADTSGHGGADPLLIAEFVRFVRDGGPTMTSPVAAREAVAAAFAATTSLRSGGDAVDVPLLAPELAAWFAGGQE